MKDAADYLVSSLFEPPCAGCRQRLPHPLDGAVCEGCWQRLRQSRHLQQRHPRSAIDWWCAVDHYEDRLKEIIHALKYERRRSISPRLGALMRECGASMLADADAVVPVPLHPRRHYERGFNQAADLAQHLGPPLLPMLKRVKYTRSQIELPKQERSENVRDAFAFVGRQPSGSLRVVVLVDDVSTTGATLDACARVLKAAGVAEVRALTAARVVSEPR
ncbi:MAG TPA: ComF family protein [Vicinamibacterales bacterium]|nr:ComF family protein [Vicinamibacterales bacterium]